LHQYASYLPKSKIELTPELAPDCPSVPQASFWGRDLHMIKNGYSPAAGLGTIDPVPN